MKVFHVTLSTIWSDTVRISACFFHIITKPCKDKIIFSKALFPRKETLSEPNEVLFSVHFAEASSCPYEEQNKRRLCMILISFLDMLLPDLQPVHLAGQPHCVPGIDHKLLGPGHKAGDRNDGGPGLLPLPGLRLVTHVVIQQRVTRAVRAA